MNSDTNIKSTEETKGSTKITIKSKQYHNSDDLIFFVVKHINCNCLIAYFYKIF